MPDEKPVSNAPGDIRSTGQKTRPDPVGAVELTVEFSGTRPTRKRLSPSPENPATGRLDPSLLSAHQRALRAAMIDAFNAKKARRFIERNIKHIAVNRELADGIKFLFDEHGFPPANAPLEDVVEERRRIEYQIVWFEGILAELRNRLVRVREVEDYALEMLAQAVDE
jgi:hypothetical protein